MLLFSLLCSFWGWTSWISNFLFCNWHLNASGASSCARSIFLTSWNHHTMKCFIPNKWHGRLERSFDDIFILHNAPQNHSGRSSHCYMICFIPDRPNLTLFISFMSFPLIIYHMSDTPTQVHVYKYGFSTPFHVFGSLFSANFRRWMPEKQERLFLHKVIYLFIFIIFFMLSLWHHYLLRNVTILCS